MKSLQSWLNLADAAWLRHASNPKVQIALQTICNNGFELDAIRTSWKLAWLQEEASKEAQ